MKILLSIITVLIILLQYRLWYGDGGIKEIQAYQQRLDDLNVQVEENRERNEALYAEVKDLRKGQEALEERARDELGMIRKGETFFQVIER
ncbi:MAG: cell division protein FtsB [Methylococcales bacterium]|nr:cell division protein FtsB [Methylococcales bacterium]